jgi:type VI protein secretion system component Hcp
MARHIIGIALAALVSFSAIAHADAKSSSGTQAKKSHVSIGMIVITKKYDKASPSI